jgi:hypothetical protein
MASLIAVDYNPLLTTVAAVSGGTAAIIGGFVLSTIINLAADRSRLGQTVEDLELKLRELRFTLHSEEEKIRKGIEEDVFKFLVTQFEDQPNDLDLNRCRSLILSHSDVELENLDEVISQYLVKREAAERFVHDTLGQIETDVSALTWRDFVLNNSAVSTLHLPLVEQFFNKFKERKLRESLIAAVGREKGSTAESIRSNQTKIIAVGSGGRNLAFEIQELRQKEEQYENFLRDKREELNANRLPRFVSFGAFVFVYQIVACVIFPLSLVGAPASNIGARQIIVLRILFDFQFGLIFSYIFLLIRPFLRRSRDLGKS